MFVVIPGYLITSLLAAENAENAEMGRGRGSISIPRRVSISGFGSGSGLVVLVDQAVEPMVGVVRVRAGNAQPQPVDEPQTEEADSRPGIL